MISLTNTTTIIITVVLVALLGAAVVFRTLNKRKKTRRQQIETHNLAGHSEVMGSHEIKRRAVEGDNALVLGELIDPDHPEKASRISVLDSRVEASFFVGPPGSGKTKTLISPNILRHNGPVFASTTKGDIIQDTIRGRQAKGDEIYVFDPGGELMSSHDEVLKAAQQHVKIWTPLNEAVTWDRAEAVAEAMVSASKQSSGGNDFFALQSKNVVAALLVLMRSKPGCSLATVMEYVTQLSGMAAVEGGTAHDAEDRDFWDEVLEELQAQQTKFQQKVNLLSEERQKTQKTAFGGSSKDQNVREIRDKLQSLETKQKKVQGQLTALQMAWKSFMPAAGAAKAAETRAGIVGAIAQLTGAWLMSPLVMDQSWDGPTSFRIENLPSDRCTVYMACPEETHRPLANAFLGAYMKEMHRRAVANGGKLDKRHLVVLDELVYCTPHRELRSWANNVARSANIKLVLGTQSYADLEITWDEAQARALFNACKGSKALLPGATDTKLLDEFSKLAGKRNLLHVSSVSETKGKSANYSVMGLNKDGSTNHSKSTTVTQSVSERDTASPARLAAMPADTALIWLPGTPGVPGGTVQSRPEPIYLEGTVLNRASQGDVEAVRELATPPRYTGHAVNLENPLHKWLPKKKPQDEEGNLSQKK